MRKILRLRNEMILDTNFLIEVLKNNSKAVEKLHELKEKREPILIPPGVLYELYTGAKSEREIKRIENKIKRAELTPRIEKEAAQIRKKLENRGKPVSSVDYLIAGTAQHLDEKILTNDQHFKTIEKIEIEEF